MRRKNLFASSVFVSSILIVSFAVDATAQTPAAGPRPGPKAGASPATGGTGSSTGSSAGASNSSTSSQKPPANGQPTTLICRMGGNMVWTLVNQFELVQTQLNGKNVRVPVVVALFDQLKFARGGAAQRDGSSLQPGSCGWTDHAMTAADPDTLIADADSFMFNETVLWGNGSTTRGETTMSGGSLSFQNKQVFSMQVTLFNGVMLKVVPGTKPKALSK